jgi:hypothetical protein
MGSLRSFGIYKYFRVLWIRMWRVSTLPHHLSGRPPTWLLHRLPAIGVGVTSDAELPLPWDLRSDLPLLLGLRVTNLILQKRRRWATTFISGQRFVRKCIWGWASIWESPWPSARIPNNNKNKISIQSFHLPYAFSILQRMGNNLRQSTLPVARAHTSNSRITQSSRTNW